jgi:hypothetical protein
MKWAFWNEIHCRRKQCVGCVEYKGIIDIEKENNKRTAKTKKNGRKQ